MIDGKKFVPGWRILLLKTSPNSYSKSSSMNDLEALKTRQIVVENVKLGISSLTPWSNFGTNRDFWWMLLALGPQMMSMLLEKSSGAPVIASSITEIDEIMIKNLYLVMTTIACGHEIDAQKFKEFCLAPAKLYVALYLWYYLHTSLSEPPQSPDTRKSSKSYITRTHKSH
ncbi:hypothetical protein TNCV_342121 [Trichonephila clavipes]|nr:hypothetical protein TNCV_342121 [Trichonephila clavipes]